MDKCFGIENKNETKTIYNIVRAYICKVLMRNLCFFFYLSKIFQYYFPNMWCKCNIDPEQLCYETEKKIQFNLSFHPNITFYLMLHGCHFIILQNLSITELLRSTEMFTCLLLLVYVEERRKLRWIQQCQN